MQFAMGRLPLPGSLFYILISLTFAFAIDDRPTFGQPVFGTQELVIEEPGDVPTYVGANTSLINQQRIKDPCSDIKVSLSHEWLQGDTYMYINCSFDRSREQVMTVAYYSGRTMLFLREYITNRVLHQSSMVTGIWDQHSSGNWSRIKYHPPSGEQSEDLHCHVADRSMGDGHDTNSPVMQAVPEVYYHGVCVSCSGSTQEIIVEDVSNVTLTCKVENVRPEVLLFWDEPFTLVPGSELIIPGKGVDGKHFDQSQDATALIDNRQHHWHVCCTAESTDEDKYTISSPDVYIKYRPKSQ